MIRARIRAYLVDHPQAKRKELIAQLGLTPKQVDNALRIIRYGKQKPAQTKQPKPTKLPVTHALHSIWR